MTCAKGKSARAALHTPFNSATVWFAATQCIVKVTEICYSQCSADFGDRALGNRITSLAQGWNFDILINPFQTRLLFNKEKKAVFVVECICSKDDLLGCMVEIWKTNWQA